MDSFLHNHQSALDSQREDDAIKDLQDSGIYPDPDNEEISEALVKNGHDNSIVLWDISCELPEEV